MERNEELNRNIQRLASKWQALATMMAEVQDSLNQTLNLVMQILKEKDEKIKESQRKEAK